MKNEDLIKRLQTFPANLPIMFKVDQDLTGSDTFSWMRGEVGNIEVTEVYEDKCTEGFLVERDTLLERVNDDPEAYGLEQDATEADMETYADKIKETVIAIHVRP